ncbi:hypothetical protein FK220_002375 [Flavobacteriaceae bacterium TP-CH-4]|uniref:Uncharacterized protein n=1 Tax=Pelagihabitans pacificus TaxID=2696054 RepID=A0A967E544_9FLAO|nr:hypothetical protein [Pelagihabitans pacificus]NHF58170.1 hypothetical protein [Pelagihabitans pacificus]
MNVKKLLVQVLVAMVLFVIISVILEKQYTMNVVLDKSQKAVIFGIIYGIIIWAGQKFRNKKE